MGGALKNVLAIACGISDGLGFGNNGRAALITRGLSEMTRLVLPPSPSPSPSPPPGARPGPGPGGFQSSKGTSEHWCHCRL